MFIVQYCKGLNYGDVLGLGEDRVLWIGGPVTVFGSYEEARQAIRRTKRYVKKYDYTWFDLYGELKIKRAEFSNGG